MKTIVTLDYLKTKDASPLFLEWAKNLNNHIFGVTNKRLSMAFIIVQDIKKSWADFLLLHATADDLTELDVEYQIRAVELKEAALFAKELPIPHTYIATAIYKYNDYKTVSEQLRKEAEDAALQAVREMEG